MPWSSLACFQFLLCTLAGLVEGFACMVLRVWGLALIWHPPALLLRSSAHLLVVVPHPLGSSTHSLTCSSHGAAVCGRCLCKLFGMALWWSSVASATASTPGKVDTTAELGQRGVAPSGVEWSGNGSSQQQTDDLMRTADFCRAKHLIVSQRAHSARSLASNAETAGGCREKG